MLLTLTPGQRQHMQAPEHLHVHQKAKTVVSIDVHNNPLAVAGLSPCLPLVSLASKLLLVAELPNPFLLSATGKLVLLSDAGKLPWLLAPQDALGAAAGLLEAVRTANAPASPSSAATQEQIARVSGV